MWFQLIADTPWARMSCCKLPCSGDAGANTFPHLCPFKSNLFYFFVKMQTLRWEPKQPGMDPLEGLWSKWIPEWFVYGDSMIWPLSA